MGLINKINVGGIDYDIASGINITLTMNAETSAFNPISAEDLEKLTTGLMQGASNVIATVTVGDMSTSMSWAYNNSTETQYLFRSDQVSWNDETKDISLNPQIFGINMTTGAISVYVSGNRIDFNKMGN